MKGYAPGWQVRCVRCGHTRPAADVGMIRVAAWSWKKYILGRCTACARWRWLAVERLREKAAPDVTAREV